MLENLASMLKNKEFLDKRVGLTKALKAMLDTEPEVAPSITPVAAVKRAIPQSEEEVRAWLAEFPWSGTMADVLVEEDFVGETGLRTLLGMEDDELKGLFKVKLMPVVNLKKEVKKLLE